MKAAAARLRVRDLAIATGRPAFRDALHVGRPSIGSQEALLKRLREMLDRRWFTNSGPMVQEFEERLKEILGVRHCIPTCNATVALEIAIRALDLRGEVIVPSFTFVATPHALEWQRIKPVFCDIGPNSHNLDPEQVERAITSETTGIIGVHVWGKPCEHETLSDIAERNNLALLYDASHAFGCSSLGRKIGNYGACEVFSFHATKFINTFEGGAIATNDDELAKKIRLMKNFGFDGLDHVAALGINGKMSEPSAAMGLTGLEAIDRLVEANKRNYREYRDQVEGLPGVQMVVFDEDEQNNFQYIVLEIDECTAGMARDELVQLLQTENVLARRYFYPGCHNMEPYRSRTEEQRRSLPRTEEVCRRVLVLPTGEGVPVEAVQTICSVIRAALGEPEEAKRLLRQLARRQAE